MPEGQAPVKDEPEKTENEQAPETVTEADVLEEDDDFEDFEHEGQYNFFFYMSIRKAHPPLCLCDSLTLSTFRSPNSILHATCSDRATRRRAARR